MMFSFSYSLYEPKSPEVCIQRANVMNDFIFSSFFFLCVVFIVIWERCNDCRPMKVVVCLLCVRVWLFWWFFFYQYYYFKISLLKKGIKMKWKITSLYLFSPSGNGLWAWLHHGCCGVKRSASASKGRSTSHLTFAYIPRCFSKFSNNLEVLSLPLTSFGPSSTVRVSTLLHSPYRQNSQDTSMGVERTRSNSTVTFDTKRLYVDDLILLPRSPMRFYQFIRDLEDTLTNSIGLPAT